MKINKQQIYWIFISTLLTAFGALELLQLINMFICDSWTTKTSTLPLNAKLLSESLGFTICTLLRPNLTFLKERNISENIFNYAVSFYHLDEKLEIVGDPSLLRLELENILNDNITDKSLKQFFQMAATKPFPPFSTSDKSLRLEDITYQGSTVCNQYGVDQTSYADWRWLEQGTTVINFRENFFHDEPNTKYSFISIYNHDDFYHPSYSESFLSFKFHKNIDHLSKIKVQVTKYERKLNCKSNRPRLIPPINLAKVICFEICAESFGHSNCSRANEIFTEISKSKPLCNYYDEAAFNYNEGNNAIRQCVADRRCNEAHFCTEWAFDINFQGVNGNEPKIKAERNQTDEAYGLHQLWIYFLGNSYLIEEVQIMTADILLANVGGLLGLLCGFELTMAAKFLYDRFSALFSLMLNGCSRTKSPRITSAWVDRKFVETEIGFDHVYGKAWINSERAVKEITEA